MLVSFGPVWWLKVQHILLDGTIFILAPQQEAPGRMLSGMLSVCCGGQRAQTLTAGSLLSRQETLTSRYSVRRSSRMKLRLRGGTAVRSLVAPLGIYMLLWMTVSVSQDSDTQSASLRVYISLHALSVCVRPSRLFAVL